MEITVFWEALCTHGRGALSRFKNLTLLLDKHGKIRDFLPEQPILMIKMFSSPMDQVLQGGIQREPCPYPRCSRSSSDTCPRNPAPQGRACAVPQAGRPAATLGPTPRMGTAGSSVARAWMLQACTGCPPPGHRPALPAPDGAGPFHCQHSSSTLVREQRASSARATHSIAS